MADEPGPYAVRVRHPGFVDRMVRVRDCYHESSIDHWCHGDGSNALRLPSREAAVALAHRLAESFGARGYRFDVMEERLVPRWRPVTEGD